MSSGAVLTFLDPPKRCKLYLLGPCFSLFICAVLVQQFNFEDLVHRTGGQGDSLPALLSVLGHSWRSWILLKGRNHSFQDQVSACLYVQYLFSNSISKIWCTGQEDRVTHSLRFYQFWGILDVLGSSWKVEIIAFRTRFQLVHMCSTCSAI